jgi:hypothetical protein
MAVVDAHDTHRGVRRSWMPTTLIEVKGALS